ncbi:putative nuclease HARBI1 [Pecten maximus]|uniref:putative nuclease HARBI1 n=1 Tax=Pecten maximus TaxID=6579 RepID=UPI00145815A3|nr:putative nuclease HARBI1 [Pecten maximus]XP_033740286.1 putative nuclease HARBI1 [Pecten maximus]XP_033758996.1 putative nuclease HARBI1 [Pecten maximus]
MRWNRKCISNMATNTVTSVLSALEMGEDDDNFKGDDLVGVAIAAYCACCVVREPRSRILNYADTVIPEYNETEFRRMFRLSRETFQKMSSYLKDCPELVVGGTGGREPIAVEKQLYVTLWYLGGSDSIIKIADRFGISESSVVLCRRRIIDAILKNLKHKFISWPKNQSLQETVDKFEQRNGFPGIVGSLDGTHIPIRAPKENAQSYVNRKKFHSLHLQAVCNSEMIFTDCFAGYPGSCHDARVLRNSDLWENGLLLCNGNHTIADGAYPLRRWLLTPFRDNGHLTYQQKNFNYMLSANRVVIERAFGLLKGRFRRLNYLDTQSIKTAVEVIMVSCVLHNICLIHNDEYDDYLEIDPALDCPRQQAMHMHENDNEGVIKRDIIARRMSGN